MRPKNKQKVTPGASSDPLRMAEGIKGGKRGFGGSSQGSHVSP